MTRIQDLKKGALASVPLALSVVPFGIVAAIAAQEAGLSNGQTVGMSLIIFAGASQLTVVELLKAGSPAFILIAAAFLVNLRFVMYSASLAELIGKEATPVRAVASYFITDQAYGLTASLTEKETTNRVWFFLGAGISLWVTWQLSTVAGLVLGNVVPPSLSLEFSVGLAFIALVVPHIKDRASLVATVVSVAAYVLVKDLPYGLPLLPAAAAGIAGGLIVESRTT